MEQTKGTQIGLEEILLKAGEILESSDSPIKVAWLGQELNRVLDVSIRQVLGTKPLGDLLLERYGDTYEIQGIGPHKEIGKQGTWKFRHPGTQYRSEFWTCFNTPRDSENRRWISKISPFISIDQKDCPGEQYLEIEPRFLILEGQDVPNAAKFVRQNIQNWAVEHNFDLNLVQRPEDDQMPRSPRRDERSEASSDFGMRAVRALLDAIPENERSQYSIPLDLLARLLSK